MKRNENWDHPFDILLAITKTEIDKNKPPGIITSSNQLDSFSVQHEAKFNVWNLYKNALETLKADGRNAEMCGDLPLAQSRASLRSSELAKTLNVSLPTYQRDKTLTAGRNVDDKLALDLIHRLFESTTGDIQQSRLELKDAINFARMRDQDMPEAGPMLQQVFMQVMRGKTEEMENLLYGTVHRQMASLLEETVTAARDASKMMLTEIKSMRGLEQAQAPAKPKFQRSRRTDLYGF